jgi:hypothetical protein
VKLQAKLSEPKCRVCQSPRRAEADALIARLGEEDPKLGVISLGSLSESILPLLLGRSLSPSSIKRHRQLHCVRVEEDGDTAAGEVLPAVWNDDGELSALIEEVGALATAERVSPTALLQLQQRLWLLDLRRRLQRGEAVTVTADSAQRAADKLLTVERQAAGADLVMTLAQGIGQAFKGKIEIFPGPEIIEGEVVEAEDAEVVE